MQNSQVKIIERQIAAFDIDKRRDEFATLAAAAGLHWRQQLIAAYPQLFDSAAGVGILDNVRKGVAGLKNTVLVIECLKQLPPPPADTDMIKRQKLRIPETTNA